MINTRLPEELDITKNTSVNRFHLLDDQSFCHHSIAQRFLAAFNDLYGRKPPDTLNLRSAGVIFVFPDFYTLLYLYTLQLYYDVIGN